MVIYNVHLPHHNPELGITLQQWLTRLQVWSIPVPFGQGSATQPMKQPLNISSDNFLSVPYFVANGIVPLFLVVGDFNLHLSKPADDRIQWTKSKSRLEIALILNLLGTSAIPMSMSSSSVRGTRGTAVLDYICIPKDWLLRIYDFVITPVMFSDHALLCVSIYVSSTSSHRPPYWRFKNLLLTDKTFVTDMTNFIKAKLPSIESEPSDIIGNWDSFKLQCSDYAKSFWCAHKKRLCHPEDGLKKRMRPPSQILFLRDVVTDGILSDHQEIAECLSSYYENLYTPEIDTLMPPNEMTFGMTKIDRDVADSLSNELQLNELTQALEDMKPNKAPGCDGLTMEFYLKFWPILGPVILFWANQVVSNGQVMGTASVGVITLIFKKGDPRDIINWRPITLLTVDVKIILKAVSNRLKPVITSVIPPTQSGLPGRTIYDCLHIIRDTIALHKKQKLPLYILSIDQQKAFDRVSHPFLFHLLHMIGLPDSLINIIQAFYSGFKCQVKNVTYLTPTFAYQRGVRQGDPLATILYVIALQPVLNAVNLILSNDSQFNAKRASPLIAYADDITIFLSHPDRVPRVLEIFGQISKYSEAVLNLEKSSITCFGQDSASLATLKSYHNVPISAGKITILGITFAEDGRVHPDQWEVKLAAAKEMVSTATNSLKNISYFERARWINSRLWPRFAYLFKALQPTIVQIEQLNSVLAEAIWLGARHWLPINALTAPVEKGGINLISVMDKISVFRIQFICRCISMGPGSPIFEQAEEILGRLNAADLGFRVLHTICDETRQSDLPAFYWSALKAWSKLPTLFFPSSRQTLMMLPCFNSKPLQDMQPQFGLSATQAFMYKTYTIEHFLSHKPKKQTRTQVSLKTSMISTVEQWKQTSAPLCPCMSVGGEKEFQLNDVRVPTFYIPYNDGLIHSCSWPSRQVYKVLTQDEDQSKPSSSIWRVVKGSVAPAVYKNRFWRLLHGAAASSSFLYKIGAAEIPMCALCLSQDLSLKHQFQTCTKLQLAMELLHEDINRLGLQIDDLPFALFTGTRPELKLANILIMAFVYSTMELIKVYADRPGISQSKVKDNFIHVLAGT